MKEHLVNLLNYELWANQRVIAALETVDVPPTRALEVMGHILSAQHAWFGRISGETVFVSIWEDIPVVWMAETADRQHRHMLDYLNTTTEGEIYQQYAFTDAQGETSHTTMLNLLTHMSHHAAYHRGQVVQLIRPLLTTAPVTDYIVWVREHQTTASEPSPSD